MISFYQEKEIFIFIAFSSCEGVVEPVWFFSPPEKRTVKQKSFRCQQEVLFYTKSSDQLHIATTQTVEESIHY